MEVYQVRRKSQSYLCWLICRRMLKICRIRQPQFLNSTYIDLIGQQTFFLSLFLTILLDKYFDMRTAMNTSPGGPGSGKGTQCGRIVEHFGFTHLSAGDLLRAEINSGSENGTMIQNMITEGKIVPSEVTVKLLQRAMKESRNNRFLIDGFPRNKENRSAFEEVTKIEPDFVLFFDCSEEQMERRLLNRNQGRVDDNIETIRKRFKVFVESSLPVIEYYNAKGKVQKIDAGRPVEEVFETVKEIFSPFSTNTRYGH